MELNLNALSLKELRDLQGQVARAVASFEDRRMKEAQIELEEKARSLGFTLSQFTNAVTSSRKRTPASVKYVNPADRSQTWTGRGRRPAWFVAALAAGSTPDDMAV